MPGSRKIAPFIKWILSIGLVLLTIMFIMRVGLFLYFNQQGNKLSELGSAFLLGLRFDLRTISTILLICLILGSIRPINPYNSERARRWWFVFIGVVLFLFLFTYFIDFAHYAYLTQRLNASVLNYLQDAAISLNMVWESYPVLWLVLGLLVLTALCWLLIRWLFLRYMDSYRVSPRTRFFQYFVCFVVFGILIFGTLSQFPLRWSDAFALGSDYKANLALNPFESFFNTLQFRKNSYDEKKLKQLYPLLTEYYGLDGNAEDLDFKRTVTPDSSYPSPPNVILVICESFSAYKSSYFGNPYLTTPFFDSLCRNGIIYDRCFTPAYGTARGVWATITGIPDVESPATASRNPSVVDQHTIMNDFRNHEKFYFLGGSTSWANIRGLLTNNIDSLKIYEQDNFEAPKIDVWGISDKNLFLEANRILAKRNKPFFAIIQTADNHRPYTIPDEDLKEFKLETLPEDSLKKYSFESLAEFNAFRYTDFSYRKFMEAASREKYFSNTIFIFVGDHGIPGNASAMFPSAWTEQRLTQHHVPLLFYGPKFFGHRRENKIVSQVDVMPTIAGLSRIPYTNTTLGRDLLRVPEGKDFAFLFDLDNRLIGVIDDQNFYRRQIKTTKEELYPVTDSAATIKGKSNKEYQNLSDAVYEAAKYLLINNKKKNAQ